MLHAYTNQLGQIMICPESRRLYTIMDSNGRNTIVAGTGLNSENSSSEAT